VDVLLRARREISHARVSAARDRGPRESASSDPRAIDNPAAGGCELDSNCARGNAHAWR
jgi:hypothetical protein